MEAISGPFARGLFSRVHVRWLALAGILALVGCGPRVAPQGPGQGPSDSAAAEPGAGDGAGDGAAAGAGSGAGDGAGAASWVPVRPGLREVLIGEMCPRGAAGRPGVLPMFVRTLSWSAGVEDVSAAVERRSVRQLSVLAWDGRRAGIFSVAGAAGVGLDRDVAVGAYAGVSPCAQPAGDAGRAVYGACVDAQADCGLALGVLEPSGGLGARPFAEDPDPAALAVAGACVAGDNLLVDIDGDGAVEAYPAAAFLDPIRAPAEEVLAVPRGAATCAPEFARRHVIAPGDPRHWQGMDLIGVIDVDGDGRRELIMLYHYAERRTWAVYSALSSAGRLDLVGEAEPWPVR